VLASALPRSHRHVGLAQGRPGPLVRRRRLRRPRLATLGPPSAHQGQSRDLIERPPGSALEPAECSKGPARGRFDAFWALPGGPAGYRYPS